MGLFAWPVATRAQQPAAKLYKIGLLQGSQNENTVAFTLALKDLGYIDGQNAQIEIRFFGSQLDRIDELAKELVDLQCGVVVAAGPQAIKAATAATRTIPIVGIDLESDPVASGWATSLGRPGGNFTGLFLDVPELGGKQVELLREAVPTLSRLAVVWDSSIGAVQFYATQSATRATGIELNSLPIQSVADIDGVFERASALSVHGIVILSSPLIYSQRVRVAELAQKARLPTISLFTLLPRYGVLMAYGPHLPDMYRRAGSLIDRIFKGATVAETPIERPTRFELVINLKTAKALGLTISSTLLARADEVIE